MKHIEIAVRLDRGRTPPFLTYLLTDGAVTEARIVDWNRITPDRSTELYAISGDVSTFVDLTRETTGVESIAVSAVDESVSFALIEIHNQDIPVFGDATRAINRAGLVVRRPLVFRDRYIEVHIVGDPDALQATFDDLPGCMSVEIRNVVQFPSARTDPLAALSERQFEAITTALSLGYYDTPREATQEDIATELECATNTASRHLQKAEEKLIKAVMRGEALDRPAIGRE